VAGVALMMFFRKAVFVGSTATEHSELPTIAPQWEGLPNFASL
jgi:hypothetical protein